MLTLTALSPDQRGYKVLSGGSLYYQKERSHLPGKHFVVYRTIMNCPLLRRTLARAAATGAFIMTERSYPTSEVRGRSHEDPMPEGRWQEELPHVRGQGQWPRVPGCDGTGTAERNYPTSEVRGGGQEELPHIPGQGGGREDLPHAGGQGPRPGGATPPPRSSGCRGTGGPRGATPHSRL